MPGLSAQRRTGTQTGATGESHRRRRFRAARRRPSWPRYFPDLEILELVGRGGMGVVYKARQKRLDRLVALKILAPKIGHDPAFAERFAREARAMAMLSHPHIVAVHDFGQTEVAGGMAERSEGWEADAAVPSPAGRGRAPSEAWRREGADV